MPAEDSWGGPVASEPPFVNALRRSGVDVTIETYVYGDKERPTPFLSRIDRVLRTALRFRRLLRRESFDVIHLNTAFDRRTVLRDSVSIFFMRPGRSRIFLKIHGSSGDDIPRRSILFRFLIRYLARRTDGLGVHTREEMEELERLGFAAKKMFRVKNAIDVEGRIPSEFRRTHKEPHERSEILFISRFIKAKGLIETIKACGILRDQRVDFRLTCIGDGEMRAGAEALVECQELTEHVKFTGYVSEDEVFERLLHGDVLVFPTSHREGFPNILFRAVAVGLPIVTTRVRAGGEYLSEPDNCLFCNTDPGDIAARLRDLIGDKSLRERMSAANIEFGRQLTREKVAEEFFDIYLKMMKMSESSSKDP